LTATSLSSDSFTADVMVQTLSLTSLGPCRWHWHGGAACTG
jgi:riboflavin synthase alpha subunit